MRKKLRTPRAGGFLASISAIGAAALTSVALGSPYASQISESSGTVSYTLNEDATSVSIVRDGVRTSLGAMSKGTHTFTRDGASSYYIEVSKTAAPGYTLVSTDSNETNFELPRGVGVNTNPGLAGAPNPNFGRVYVANGRESTTGLGRAMVSGFYGLNADLTGNFEARTGGVSWSTGTDSSSPFRVQVGPDNQLYVADWSDSHAGLWALDPDANTNVEVLDSTGRDSTGLNAVHGSISDVVIRGTGAARTIYTTDEDFNGGQMGIYRYNVGTTPTTTTPPATVFDNSAGVIINSFDSLDQAKDGTFWMSQNRSAGTDQASLIQVDPATGTVLYNSLDSLGSPDPLRGTQGMAYDPVHNILALVGNSSGEDGRITLFDPTTKSIITTFDFGNDPASGFSGTTTCDVAFDAAGNLYITDRSCERLRVWSPGSDSVWTSGSDGSFTNSLAVVPEPTSLAFLGLGGLLLGARRRRNGTA